MEGAISNFINTMLLGKLSLLPAEKINLDKSERSY